jgi:ribonuclease HI
MELLAAIRGLEALTTPSTVRLFSDSQYLVRGMSEWIHGWIRSGRLETPDALANQDLWQQLVALSGEHEITWSWVRGHAGHPFNERCDKLAKRAADEGVRETEERLREADRPAERAKEEKLIPSPVAPREDSEFEAEEDGQLRLC